MSGVLTALIVLFSIGVVIVGVSGYLIIVGAARSEKGPDLDRTPLDDLLQEEWRG